MIDHAPKIDYENFVEVYNQQGKSEAIKLANDLYGLNFLQIKRRLEKDTDYRYDRPSGEYRHREVPMNLPEKFLSLDDLERSRKPLQTTDQVPPDMNFDQLIIELVYDRGLELSQYIKLNHVNHTVVIDRTSLLKDGFRVVEK